MGALLDHQVIKSIGASGQISLGKEHAGRQVLVEMPELGVWVIRTATVIPEMSSGYIRLLLKRIYQPLWIGRKKHQLEPLIFLN